MNSSEFELLALGDVLTDALLPKHAGLQTEFKADPSVVLLVYLWTSTVLAVFFHSSRKGWFNPMTKWGQYTREQRSHFLRLGFATWIVYAATVWGIFYLSAPIFNVIDYAGMPLITVLAGAVFLKEELKRAHIFFGALACVGVTLIFLSQAHSDTIINGYVGIPLAAVSAFFTSYCSALQKRQVDSGLHPDEVLLFRFPIPAVLMTIWVILRPAALQGITSVRTIVTLVIVGAVCVFLPLLLLCFGFMKASLGQFSRYLLLIPLLTWVAIPVLLTHYDFKEWHLISGAFLLCFSYLASEFVESRRRT